MADHRDIGNRALAARIRETPRAEAGTDATPDLAEFLAVPRLAALLASAPVAALLAGTMTASPYLTSLMRRDPERLADTLAEVPEERFSQLTARLESEITAETSQAAVMRLLRRYKSDVALLAALADLGGVWPVMTVTHSLTEAADAAVSGAVRFLLREAVARGDWQGSRSDAPDSGSGFIVLGVGKYGAFELNYSSDIDLIVFYDASLAEVRPGLEIATFFVRMTRDLVRLLSERTADGYVFRTDLRLRPDAGATQIAISVDAAISYYESLGQNWERAALIKARPVAGDLDAGEAFLQDIAPFIWRRHLDFAAIADIHAMKRQIHAVRGFGSIGVAGHNIKLGRGGIREIEFFVQTQQLIAGGRHRHLRTRRTLEAMTALVALAWIDRETADALTDAYLFLRRLEHRLQMLADEQTHTLPTTDDDLSTLARFAGFASSDDLSRALIEVLSTVERHYARLFERAQALTSAGANMVFAGEEDDPATVAALSAHGFKRPSDLLAIVRGWHHGRYRAVRSTRARELLTEMQPLLVEAFAGSIEPDQAAACFDRFLAQLPAGVQLFSLLQANPALMQVLADVMGTAPRLAHVLSRRPRLLDALIDPRTSALLSGEEVLETVIAAEFAAASGLEDRLDRARIIGSEQAFLIGVKVLSGTITASAAGAAYAMLAECLIRALARAVEQDLVREHGRIPGGSAAVVAMGKLGGREMTASSDLDLIVVYDFDPEHAQSDGSRSLAATHYYTRFTQRLINALQAPTREGALYEVDMRLRPSGQKGPVAAQLSTFVEYQTTEAWTWEHMALTRARVVAGPEPLKTRVEAAIRDTLVRPRHPARIAADVRDMRRRIEAEKGTANIWDLKQVRGGLVDLEFAAQYLQLVHAGAHPGILSQTTEVVFQRLAEQQLLRPAKAATLIEASRLIHNLTQVLRLCLDEPFNPTTAPEALKALLARAGDEPTFDRLESKLSETLKRVQVLYHEII